MRNGEFLIDIDTQGLGVDFNLIEKAILAALMHQGFKHSGEISVLCVEDAEMMGYNLEHRGKEGTTDVLSFPQYSAEEIANTCDEFICLGDIIINIDSMRRQAEEYEHSQARELAFLIVHSALHLLGYDHDTEDAEERMFALQEEILGEMGLGR
ncbi:MAG: rRNA maturation RNase YbeY [Defluviitaleaceae bacterium]|nr:rRNA maturation RNase YbeY [Defluviitaleaceae bacterium]